MMHKMATSHNIQDLLGFWREALGSTSMKVKWLPSFSFYQGRKVYMKLCLLVVSLYPGRKAYMYLTTFLFIGALLTNFLFVWEDGLHEVAG